MTARWQDQAACAEIGTALFLPDDDSGDDRWNSSTYTAGKRVCAGCPVRADCLEHAMAMEGGSAHQYRSGLWGGLTPNQRAQLARARRARTTGTAA